MGGQSRFGGLRLAQAFGGVFGGDKIIPILKNNLTALARLAVLGVLSAARRLVILFFRIGINNIASLLIGAIL